MSMKRTILTLLCLAACATNACAAVQSDLEYQSYGAHAERGKSLYQKLAAASPIHENGRVFLGHTRDDIHWQLHWHDTGNGMCRVDDVGITLHTVILLPDLAGIDPDRQAEYTRFYLALRIHEYGHYRIELEMADTIDKALTALPEHPCNSIEHAVNERGQELIGEFARREQQYDAETDHGRTQGAFLKN